jgi:hypothetical protein
MDTKDRVFNTETPDQYNWADLEEDSEKMDQHFGRSEGANPCHVFSGGIYETLEEGCYIRRPCALSDDI